MPGPNTWFWCFILADHLVYHCFRVFGHFAFAYSILAPWSLPCSIALPGFPIPQVPAGQLVPPPCWPCLPLSWDHCPACWQHQHHFPRRQLRLDFPGPCASGVQPALTFLPSVPGFSICRKVHLLITCAAFCPEPLTLLRTAESKIWTQRHIQTLPDTFSPGDFQGYLMLPSDWVDSLFPKVLLRNRFGDIPSWRWLSPLFILPFHI